MRESIDFSPLLLWSIIWEDEKKKKKTAQILYLLLNYLNQSPYK